MVACRGGEDAEVTICRCIIDSACCIPTNKLSIQPSDVLCRLFILSDEVYYYCDFCFLDVVCCAMCCSYPKEPGGQHSKRRDEGGLGGRRQVVHTDPEIVPDL